MPYDATTLATIPRYACLWTRKWLSRLTRGARRLCAMPSNMRAMHGRRLKIGILKSTPPDQLIRDGFFFSRLRMHRQYPRVYYFWPCCCLRSIYQTAAGRGNNNNCVFAVMFRFCIRVKRDRSICTRCCKFNWCPIETNFRMIRLALNLECNTTRRERLEFTFYGCAFRSVRSLLLHVNS